MTNPLEDLTSGWVRLETKTGHSVHIWANGAVVLPSNTPSCCRINIGSAEITVRGSVSVVTATLARSTGGRDQ